MELIEKDGKLTNFLTPVSSILFITASITFISIIVALLDGLIGIFPVEETLYILWLNLIVDLIAAAFIIYSVIPLLKIRNVEQNPVNIASTWQTLGITSIFYALLLIFQIIFLSLLDIIYPEESQSSYGGITPTAEQFASDPTYIILFILVLSFAAPIFEELAFRRVLIETLESRGVSPISAVILSSLAFASAHTPNDLLNGNLRYALEHFFPVFIIGFGMGLSYIFTRNVIYPMLIHGIFNGISAISQYAIITVNDYIFITMIVLILMILIVGAILGIYTLIVYFSSTKNPKWKKIIKTKSEINILQGSIGFLGIFYVVMFLESFSTANISENFTDIVLRLFLIIILELIILIASYIIIVYSRYEGKGKQKVRFNEDDLGRLSYKNELMDYRQLETIFCPYCGINNPGEALFCKECGKKFEF